MSLTTFSISKDVYFSSIRTGFKSNVELLNAVKADFRRIDIIINGKKYTEYHEFLEYIKNTYPNFLEKVLLISNQCAHFYYYNKIFDILSKKDFHVVNSEQNEFKNLRTEFVLNTLIKQATLTNKYNVITVDNNSDEKIHRTMLVTTVIDLVILDPILVKIEYCDETK